MFNIINFQRNYLTFSIKRFLLIQTFGIDFQI